MIMEMRVSDVVLQWEDTRTMQVGNDIGNETDIVRILRGSR